MYALKIVEGLSLKTVIGYVGRDDAGLVATSLACCLRFRTEREAELYSRMVYAQYRQAQKAWWLQLWLDGIGTSEELPVIVLRIVDVNRERADLTPVAFPQSC